MLMVQMLMVQMLMVQLPELEARESHLYYDDKRLLDTDDLDALLPDGSLRSCREERGRYSRYY